MTPFYQTFSGQKWNIRYPKARDVRLLDIVLPLSHLPRFNGHTLYPYPVAQHLVLASHHCDFPLAALLHDTPEAYLGDVIKPLKVLLQPDLSVKVGKSWVPYSVLEDRTWKAIASAMGKPRLFTKAVVEEVKRVDEQLLFTEASDLLRGGIRKDLWANYDFRNSTRLFRKKVVPWSYKKARREFIARLFQLYRPCNRLIVEGLQLCL